MHFIHCIFVAMYPAYTRIAPLYPFIYRTQPHLLGKARVPASRAINFIKLLFTTLRHLNCFIVYVQCTRITFAIFCMVFAVHTVWPCWVCGEHERERLRKTPLSPHRYLGELPFSDMHRLCYTHITERTFPYLN